MATFFHGLPIPQWMWEKACLHCLQHPQQFWTKPWPLLRILRWIHWFCCDSQVILHQLGKLTEAKQLQGELVPLLEQRFGSTAPSTSAMAMLMTRTTRTSLRANLNHAPQRIGVLLIIGGEEGLNWLNPHWGKAVEFLTLLEKESFGKKRKSLGGASESRLCSAQEITWQDMARLFPLRRDQLEIPKKSTVFTTHFYYILLLLNFDLRNASPHRQRRGKRLRCSSLCHVQPVPSSRFIHSRWGSALSPRSACWHVERAKAMAGAWRPKVGLSGYTDLRYQHIQDLTPCRWESTGNLRNWSNRESWPEPAVCRGRDHNLPQISP